MKPDLTHPPVTWRTHYALAVLATIYVFNYIDRLVISILVEPIKAEFAISDTQIGLLSGVAFAIFYTLFGFPLGRLSDRIGRKPVVALACIAWSATTMLCGLATSFALLLLCRIGVAVGEAGGTAPSVAMVSELYPERRRSTALAVFMMGPSLGAVIGLGLGGWIAQTYGWRIAFIAIGAPGVLLGALLAMTVRASRPAARRHSDDGEAWTTTLAALLRTPSFLWVIAAGTAAAVTGYAMGTWNPSFLIRSHGLDVKEAGLLVGLGGGLMSTIGTLTCGAVTDHLVKRDRGWQLGVAAIACSLSVPLGVAFYLWPAGTAFHVGSLPVPEAFLFYLAFSFTATWWSVPCFGAMSHLFPPQRLAQATSLFVMSMTLLGVGLGPILAGGLSDLLTPNLGADALRYALAAIVSLYGVTVLCLLTAIPRFRQQRSLVATAA